MHKGLDSRITALEKVSHRSQPALIMWSGETEEQTLARCGHSPGTDALFIQTVPLKGIDHE